VIASLKARIGELETEAAKAEARAAGHRSDYERERERADRMVTMHDRLVSELETLRGLLTALQEAARPVTARAWWAPWRKRKAS
jgi:hypothetical protein